MTFFIHFYKHFIVKKVHYGRSEVWRVLGAIAGLALTGTVGYSLIEGWSPLDALYVTIITITTVGYGDFTPQSAEGRIFAIFFTLFAISIGGYSISMLAAYAIESRAQNNLNKSRKRRMDRIKALQRHYILCGADLVGTRIAEEFYLEKVDYV